MSHLGELTLIRVGTRQDAVVLAVDNGGLGDFKTAGPRLMDIPSCRANFVVDLVLPKLVSARTFGRVENAQVL